MNLFLLMIKKTVRLLTALDSLFRKIPRLFIKPLWQRVGTCKQCGLCCKLIGIEMEHRLAKIKFFRDLVVWWMRTINHFHLQEWDTEHEIFLFTCDYLKDGSCSDYKNRPQICRDYPPIRHYFKKPIFFDNCGYKAVFRKDKK